MQDMPEKWEERSFSPMPPVLHGIWRCFILTAMSTLTEIEEAVETLPRPEQEVLLAHLSAKLRTAPGAGWPVPPPDVSREEIRRIQSEIDATFSTVECRE